MRKQSYFLMVLLMISCSVFSQKYVTKTGHIRFFSSTPVENIEANNYSVNSALDVESGVFVFKVLMKSFEFEKALMQEHFNENYVESDTYPNAVFKGKILEVSNIDFQKKGEYQVVVEGELTLHGVTQKVKEQGVLKVDGNIEGNATFNIAPKDYEIKIPKAVVKNIAEEVEVTVSITLVKLSK